MWFYRKKLFYLFSILLVMLFICLFLFKASQKQFEIENVETHTSSDTLVGPFNSLIDNTKKFAENFMNSYKDLVDKNVSQEYINQFKFGEHNFHFDVIISTSRESFMYIQPSEENDMKIFVTVYPAQLELLSGLKMNQTPWSLEKVLKQYDSEEGELIYHNSSGGYISLSYEGILKKVIGIKGFRNILLIENFSFSIYGNNKLLFKNKLEYIGLLNLDVNFNWAIKLASYYAEYLFKNEYLKLYTTSNFFREAQNFLELKPEAEEILEIQSRLEKDTDFDFPFEKLRDMIKEFESHAMRLSEDKNYANDILAYPPLIPKSHYFLLYHPNHQSFMWFWVCINVFLLIMILIFVVLLKFHMLNLHKIIRKKYPKFTLYGIPSFLNLFIISNKPNNFPFRYWILPLILLALNFIIIVFRLDNKNKS